MGWFYLFFIASGFCSLTYEIVWLRISMAKFGVNAPFVAIVLSVFMGGIAIGSLLGARLARKFANRSASTTLRMYAGCELLIAAVSLIVPVLLEVGRQLMTGAAWGSSAYYAFSGGWIAVVLLPATIGMGMTFPLAMSAIAHQRHDASSFSYLYASNVLGATAGTVASAFFLIELLGLFGASWVAAAVNFTVAAIALTIRPASDVRPAPVENDREVHAGSAFGEWRVTSALLFMLGLATLGMEVVWTRQFTPYVGTVVYAFAGTLALYLAATFAGTSIYRRWYRTASDLVISRTTSHVLVALVLAGLLPVVVTDPRFPLPLARSWGPVRLIVGVLPFCALVGFLSPLLIDRWSGGDASRAGRAYAVNTIGCILGPLVASFLLLPFLSERWAVLILLLPILLLALPMQRVSWRAPVVLALALGVGTFFALDPEYLYAERAVRRDSTATVVAATVDGHKHLFVNGQGMVYLTPVTKMMAHLPLAVRHETAKNALVVCLGMGTSLRSVMSWRVPVTGVELVPSVPDLFGFFHPDLSSLRNVAGVQVVVDDGRRFLERTRGSYDMVTVDPPPPVEAAGSSLLYSLEWYAAVKRRLAPGGVLQQWLPYGDAATLTAAAKALRESFAHIRVFGSFEGWGFHILASDQPLPALTAAELGSRLPPAAAADLVELGPYSTAAEQFQAVISREVPLTAFLDAVPDTPALSDNRPINEYYLLRRVMRDGWHLYFSYQNGALSVGRK